MHYDGVILSANKRLLPPTGKIIKIQKLHYTASKGPGVQYPFWKEILTRLSHIKTATRILSGAVSLDTDTLQV